MEFKLSSDTIGAISEALAEAQGVMESAVKDSSNPHRRSKYADISSVIEAVRKPLSDNGLAFSCAIMPVENGNIMIGTLSHISGEWFKSYVPLILKDMDMQGLGAAITYARRYALSSLCSVSQADDDAESIAIKEENASVKEEKKPSQRISDAQLKYLLSLANTQAQEKIKTFYQIEDLSHLTISQAIVCINDLKPKEEKK